MDIIKALAEEFKLKEEQVAKTVEMIDNGDTIPFIARYRKEVTGSLDDAILRDLNDRLEYARAVIHEAEHLGVDQGELSHSLVYVSASGVPVSDDHDNSVEMSRHSDRVGYRNYGR